MRTLFAAFATLALTTPALAQQQQMPNCDAAEFRAFDFWIGEWYASRADTNAPAGRSSIRSEDSGCVITEHWTSLGIPYSGRSLNIYDRASVKWEQFWVDSTGNRVRFVGSPTETGIRIATETPVFVSPTQRAYSRITYTNNPDGTVLQHGEQSADGQTWAHLLRLHLPAPGGIGRSAPAMRTAVTHIDSIGIVEPSCQVLIRVQWAWSCGQV